MRVICIYNLLFDTKIFYLPWQIQELVWFKLEKNKILKTK